MLSLLSNTTSDLDCSIKWVAMTSYRTQRNHISPPLNSSTVHIGVLRGGSGLSQIKLFVAILENMFFQLVLLLYCRFGFCSYGPHSLHSICVQTTQGCLFLLDTHFATAANSHQTLTFDLQLAFMTSLLIM